jgi:hypothetical protein
VQVNPDSDEGSQFLPSIAIDQGSGALAVGWYSVSGDPGDVKSEFVIAASSSGEARCDPDGYPSFLTDGDRYPAGSGRRLGSVENRRRYGLRLGREGNGSMRGEK